MKQKILTSAFSLLLCVTLVYTVNAQDDKKRYEHFKERTISKTYPASGNSLEIVNSFGKVDVVTSGGNEIKVDIHIEASSSDADMAERTFNSISVTDDKRGNTIYFKTNVKGNNNKGCNNCKNNMSIDYTVHLPASVKLDIENSFGGISVPDYSGEISLTSKFGSLTTGALSNAKGLNVEFGTAKIKSADNINAVFKFSSIEVDNLSGSNKIKVEFCNVAKIGLTNNITSLNLNESYSTINLRPAANLSATYSMHTSFGNLVNRTGISINRTDKPDEYGPDADKDYEGRSGSGGAKIDIKSSFGNVIIGEPKPGDIKEKNKNKNKNKNEEEI
ncbi:MAG: hypothetical protein U0V75_07550 [Ferruginibacter sp.]